MNIEIQDDELEGSDAEVLEKLRKVADSLQLPESVRI
jgi:hypothetical protein